jgi:hypothetical protein
VQFLSTSASRSWAGLILGIVLASTAGCSETGLTPSPVPNPVTGQNPGDVKYYPSDQPVRMGIQRFYNIFRMRLKNRQAT